MQFDTDDVHAGLKTVQQALQLFFRIIFNFVAVACNDVFHFGLSDNFPQNRLRCDFDSRFWGSCLKQEIIGVFNIPDNSQINIDNIFVARQHMAFRQLA